jgi:hypothetical protein
VEKQVYKSRKNLKCGSGIKDLRRNFTRRIGWMGWEGISSNLASYRK